MTDSGTAAYDHCADLPPLVAAAVRAARQAGFAHSCLPEQGRLLRTLAGGVGGGVIGETGTGCGVGLAWLVSGAPGRSDRQCGTGPGAGGDRRRGVRR
ncbi:hypothetical protein [Lentzea nigeriaca]|uniref:hypothetical protein n=1 Tax=Lentzea nigeriaca TaxID=1128665 RepID=UPI0019591257|nr:hypothetical protein [Lentzea nigeriaca]